MIATSKEALFKSVIESPHDTLPRLVYADWLEENGEESPAEFIRVQCELAGDLAGWDAKSHELDRTGPPTIVGRNAEYPCEPTCRRCRSDRLVARETELLDEHGVGWYTDFVSALTGQSWQFGSPHVRWAKNGPRRLVLTSMSFYRDQPQPFRRGFVESVTLTPNDWSRLHARITARTPLRHVILTRSPAVNQGAAAYGTGKPVSVVFNIAGEPVRIPIDDIENYLVPSDGVTRLPGRVTRLLAATANPDELRVAGLLAFKNRWPKIEFSVPTEEGD